jgi:hypothetical protein
MTGKEERFFQALRRETGWFVINPQYVADNPSLGKQVDALNGIVQRVSDHATAQQVQHAQTLLISQDEIGKRQEVLSHQMAPIAQVAHALAGTVPGIGVLSMPKANIPTSQLITAATAMGEKAVIYKDVLVENGLPADFIQQLQQAAAALKASFDGRGLARASKAAATRGIGSELALARRVVSIIDAIVTRLLRSEPAKLAEWKQLKRVTVKGVVVRAPLGLVEAGSTPVATTSTQVATSSTPVQTSATDGVAASVTGAKAA